MCLTVQIEKRIFQCITLLKVLFPDILKETGVKVRGKQEAMGTFSRLQEALTCYSYILMSGTRWMHTAKTCV